MSYQKTILLDCNRRNSTELQTKSIPKNPSLFTNRIGDGISLDIGDQVSVHSAYVSSIGAGGEVIEFTGKQTGLQYTLEETNEIGTNACLTLIEGFEELNTSNIIKTFEIKDNEANFEILFYKNLNGERYYNLPRRFDKPIDETGSSATYNKQWTAYNTSVNGATIENNTTFNNNGSNANRYDLFEILNLNDYRYTLQNLPATSLFTYNNDNSRAVIFTREGIRYNSSNISASDTGQIGGNASYIPPYCSKYIPFKKIINFKTDIGFDSPSNIATTLTSQLNKLEKTKKIKANINFFSDIGFLNELNKKNTTSLSITQTTPTFQTFLSGTPYTVSKKCFESYTNSSNASATNLNSLDYYNGHTNIGVLRPDLFLNGRDLHGEYASNSASYITNGRGYFELKIGISASLSASDSEIEKLNTSRVGLIVTNRKWDEDINASQITGINMINKFKKLFESQLLYPELFDFENNASITNKYKSVLPPAEYDISVSNTRFLHMNTALYDQPDLIQHLAGEESPEDKLGDDNLVSYYKSYGGSGQQDNWDLRSAPLFLYYDENKKDIYNDDLFDWNKREDSYNKLCYGFCKRYRAEDGIDYIALTTENIGGIPEAKNASYGFYNTLNAVSTSNTLKKILPEGTYSASNVRSKKFGWDFHANAYSNRFINLYTGTFRNQAFPNGSDTQIEAQLILKSVPANTIPYTYCGAYQPLLNFDSISNRFNFSYLYSPEYLQSQFNAGQIVTQGSASIVVPFSEQVGQEVYKINKVLSKNTFCPDMIPYVETVDINRELQTTTPPNTNLNPFEIFDSQSGIFMSNFGINERMWESSLWKILGFDYNQFNNNNVNLQNRIQTVQNVNTTFITTNAEVKSSQIVEYYVTPYGNTTFEPIIPLPFFVRSGSGTDTIQILPNINIKSESAKILAKNLPIKSSRPYYLIKSDIVPNQEYIGIKNGVNLPVVAVVNKVNGYSDSFTLENSQVSFTITRPTVINNITTAITDPDGTSATVDDSSGVIYKIIKNINADLNIAETILQEQKKKK